MHILSLESLYELHMIHLLEMLGLSLVTTGGFYCIVVHCFVMINDEQQRAVSSLCTVVTVVVSS